MLKSSFNTNMSSTERSVHSAIRKSLGLDDMDRLGVSMDAILAASKAVFPSKVFKDSDNGSLKGVVMAPGFKKENISATYADGCLLLSAESKYENIESIWPKVMNKKFFVDHAVYDVKKTKITVSDGIINFEIPEAKQGPGTFKIDIN